MKESPSGTNSEYNQHVALKYQLYNSFFLTLPLGGVKDVGILIPVLAETCRTKLQQGETPKKIIEQFLKEQPNTKDQTEKFDFLFRVIQFVERQVVLIDALEDATFEDLNNLNGPGSISSMLTQAKEEKKTNTLLEKINNFSIRPVLTAHPTQFYPGRVLAIITDLTDAIKRNKTGLINTYLMQLGMTPFFKKKKPSPYDEAVNLTWYLQNIFYNSAGNIISSLRKNLSLNPGHLQLIQLGFWPGGDRDGNPFVNTDITLSVARRLKETILKCYYSDIRIIRRRISFTGVYEQLLEIEQQLLDSIREKESLDYDSFKNGIQSILNDLNTHHKGVFKELLEDFLDRITLFGFYFAALDYRQDRSIIEKTMKHVSLKTLLEQGVTADALFNNEKFSEKEQVFLYEDVHAEGNLEYKLFNQIKKLGPSEILVFNQDGSFFTKTYWSIKFRKNNLNEQDYAKKLHELLEKSVELRMVIDVPVGILLSSGIDSSIVATLAAKKSDDKLNTYTLFFRMSQMLIFRLYFSAFLYFRNSI